MRIAIISADEYDSEDWIRTLKTHPEIEYHTIDISSSIWMEKCLAVDADLYILRPPGITCRGKDMFDERVRILATELKKPVYPTLTEALIYENKKYLSYWLKAYQIPSPDMLVFYDKREAIEYSRNARYPIVAKINIGASGQGVDILRDMRQTQSYINRAFDKGLRPKVGLNMRTAPITKKLRNAFKIKGLIQKRYKQIRTILGEVQKYVLFQEYIQHTFEWRVVVIGESYFAHKKIVTGSKASGSLQKDYGNPPLDLLDFVRGVCLETNISSVAIDVFDTESGYIVNEIQTYFGQSDEYQMKVDGVIGRYRFINSKWIFEPGDYASNKCYDLRLEQALKIIQHLDAKHD